MAQSCYYAQVALNHIFVLPSGKPDVERILRAASSPVLVKAVVIAGKVVCSGYITLDMEYAVLTSNQTHPVHYVSFKIPFAHFIEHRHAKPGMEAGISLDIEFQSFDLLDRRSFCGLIILKMTATKLDIASAQTQTKVCPAEHIGNAGNALAGVDLEPNHARGGQTGAQRRREGRPRRLWNGKISYR